MILIIHRYKYTSMALQEWEDPHLGRRLVLSVGHDTQTSHSKQLSLVNKNVCKKCKCNVYL
jgi:hypothetical protein